MTPFEAKGYTKDTVFRVCTHDEDFYLGTLVQLKEDDGSERPIFDSGTDTAYVNLSSLKYVSGPRATTMNREELTTLINEILDAREGLPSIPLDFIRWRGGDRPEPRSAEVEVILRNGERFSKKASDLNWGDAGYHRDIIAYRVMSDARAVEARELREWFNEHAPTKFKQGDMVLYRGQLRVVDGVCPNNVSNKYSISHAGWCDVAREEELTRYKEGE